MQDYELQDRIQAVEDAEGEGTELVTLSVPADKDLQSVQHRIEQEYAGAENIKSDQTRKRVQQALGRIRRILRRYQATPECGLVAYAGVVDGELTEFVFDALPTPVTESRYECASEFVTDPIAHAIEPANTYGLLIVERGGAALGDLRGDRVTLVREFESQVMGKTKAGGQSAQRFARERERQKHEFFEKVADAARSAFGDPDPVDGLLLGGTTITRTEFTGKEYLDHRLQDSLLGSYPVDHASEQGLRELVEQGKQAILDADRHEARNALERFYKGLRDGDAGNVAYGEETVTTALEYGAVDTLLLSEALPTDTIRDYEDRVEDMGGTALVVSTDFEQGDQLQSVFGGCAALLRFPIN
jgi:peptide chain release factor subunit 1